MWEQVGKGVVETGREALVSFAGSAGRTTNNLLKRFANPVVASKSYRYLARQIALDLATIEGGKSIIFSSAANMDINSEILLMFAHFLQDELVCKVLVVDATFRNTGLTKLLDLGERHGFMDGLSAKNNYTLTESVTQLARGDVSFIATGDVQKNNKLLHVSESQAHSFITKLKQDYDYIILQQDFIQEDTRYLPFAKSADLVLIHLEERNTPIAKFEEAKEVFRDHQISNVKYILSEP